jgi:hypothetical protein
MKKLILLALLSSLPAQAESLTLHCVDGATRIELQSRDLETYQLKENGKISRLKPSYQDEQMIQIENTNTVYQFVNLGGCVDSGKAKTLLVLSEKLQVLRPFAALNCNCVYR